MNNSDLKTAYQNDQPEKVQAAQLDAKSSNQLSSSTVQSLSNNCLNCTLTEKVLNKTFLTQHELTTYKNLLQADFSAKSNLSKSVIMSTIYNSANFSNFHDSESHAFHHGQRLHSKISNLKQQRSAIEMPNVPVTFRKIQNNSENASQNFHNSINVEKFPSQISNHSLKSDRKSQHVTSKEALNSQKINPLKNDNIKTESSQSKQYLIPRNLNLPENAQKERKISPKQEQNHSFSTESFNQSKILNSKEVLMSSTSNLPETHQNSHNNTPKEAQNIQKIIPPKSNSFPIGTLLAFLLGLFLMVFGLSFVLMWLKNHFLHYSVSPEGLPLRTKSSLSNNIINDEENNEYNSLDQNTDEALISDGDIVLFRRRSTLINIVEDCPVSLPESIEK